MRDGTPQSPYLGRAGRGQSSLRDGVQCVREGGEVLESV